MNENETWKYCNTSLPVPVGRNFFKDELDIAMTSIVDGIFTQLVSRSKDPFSRVKRVPQHGRLKWVDFRDQEPWGAYASKLAPITPLSAFRMHSKRNHFAKYQYSKQLQSIPE